MTLALGIIIIILAVVIMTLVLTQSGKGKELSGAIAGGNNSYLGNSSISDKDKILFRITAVLSAVFVICVLVLYVIA